MPLNAESKPNTKFKKKNKPNTRPIKSQGRKTESPRETKKGNKENKACMLQLPQAGPDKTGNEQMINLFFTGTIF